MVGPLRDGARKEVLRTREHALRVDCGAPSLSLLLLGCRVTSLLYRVLPAIEIWHAHLRVNQWSGPILCLPLSEL